jgi:trehalose-6-phosphatase
LSAQEPALALYIGDDRTDEEAFRRLPPDAITIRVGSRDLETAARYVVPGPVEVQTFLTRVAAAREASGPSGKG